MRNRLSMRASLVLTILLVGSLSVVCAYFSGEVYLQLALDNQRAALADYLRVEASKRREGLETQTYALGQHAHNDAATLKVLASRQPAPSVRQLDKLFQLASGNVRIARLYLLDEKQKPIAASSAGDTTLTQPPCVAQLSSLSAARPRNRAASRICVEGDRSYYVAMSALATPAPTYLVAVSDVVSGLAAVERGLGAPLRLRRVDGTVAYQSPGWPQDEQLAMQVVAKHSLQGVPLELEAAKDMTGFYDRVANLRYLVLLFVAIVTTFIMLIALLLLESTALRPLRTLMVQLQRIRQDKRSLGEQVSIGGGNTELLQLAEGFNDMTTRLRESYETLERMAFTDSLTGLPNRSLFHDRLQQAILAAKREGKPFALLMMDLDRFKDINDTLGHQAGDVLLGQVAQRLRSKLRASDTVARMGGDEFAVLLPVVDAKHAGMAARMLLQSLRAPFMVEDHELNVGVSIGIALYPEHGIDTSVLMQRADVAMYSAKNSGSGFAFYNPAVDQNFPTRLTLLSDLRQAVEHEQFELYYQPIVSLVSNKVTGIEALARWRHPRDGVLMPDSFIPLLEQSGLIRGLMPWVVSEALKRAHALQVAGSPLTVSINLSMRDLQDPYIVESFAEQLEAYQVAAGSIVLEITESAVMTDAPRTLELLSRLSAMGLKIAIDDFGTGYSSLTYLKKLPVNMLKIDKSFVIGMEGDENDAAIVRTSIDLAHNLGLKVVAEGVETDTVLSQLKALGCDSAQGHYVGRPLTHAELENWLAQSAWGLNDAGKPVADMKRQFS